MPTVDYGSSNPLNGRQHSPQKSDLAVLHP